MNTQRTQLILLFFNTKFNNSDDQMNIDNIEQLQILQNIKINLTKIIKKRQLIISCKKLCQNQQVLMDVWIFSQSSSSFAFYIEPNCIRNHHNKFEIDRTILTCIKKLFNVKTLCKNVKNQHVSNWTYGLFGNNCRVDMLST